ncbi:MAG TPA: TRAP transporter substrate-binding protein DctP [Kofleriaceae bacterium]|nr:TRAP transporter substrate-binding protein DctP [Kofleriaceae bacterium]
MMRRSLASLLAVTVAAAAIIGATGRAAQAGEVITIGTLAPKSSPWGEILETWIKAVKVKSGGRVEVQVFYNGSQGDEAAMVGKMKAGQLDGAAITGVGLGKIYKPILAMQMPGLFTTWAKLDKARDAMKGDFEKGMKDAGFTSLGWVDVGSVHIMSNGFAVPTPDDLKGKKPYLWRDDDTAPILYQVVGGVTPVPLNVPEVLPSLNNGTIDVVMATSLWAEQLKWTSKLDTIDTDIESLSLGALVVSSKRLDSLPEDLRNIVIDTGRITATSLNARIRKEDDASFARLKKSMTVETPSADDKAKWDALFKQARARLKQGVFPASLVDKVEALAK